MSDRDVLDQSHFRFRGLHPSIFMGTASDRYAGWIGQIYSRERYEGKTTRRAKKIGSASFIEEVLPVESVQEYFQHFRILEVDYTFYRPLRDAEGQATQNFHVLRSYRSQMADGDFLILKVPQAIFARKIRKGSGYAENPSYLNAEAFIRSFYEPAVDLLGESLRSMIFEQEYQRKEERGHARELAAALDGFFSVIPADIRYHIELRTESYLAEPVFEILEKHGIGQVLSHWTWLPPLEKQFARAGGRFFNSGRQAIIRLMTPIGTRYEDAYARAHPFNRLIEGMLQPKMVDEAARLMRQGIASGAQMSVIVNNRAGGNAPLIAQQITQKYLDGET